MTFAYLVRRWLAGVLLLAIGVPATSHAQMIVSGRVTAGDRPVQGASVGIAELKLETRTAADGRYNFLIRSAQVAGQTVTITARHRQFGIASARVALTGGSIEQDFSLGRGEPRRDQPPADRRRADTTRRLPAESRAVPVTSVVKLSFPTAGTSVDSTALENVEGSLDVASALAGRIVGLRVTSASTPGGSALAVFRGPRSVTNSIQPLVVVDGIPIDNAGFRNAGQQFGLGGFDYGTPLQDLSPEDVAGVGLLGGAEATLLYGARAANGVLVIATKQGASTPGLSFSHRFNFSSLSPSRLPSFQNRFGQGSGGQYEFFDGRGGGINDATEESWGPILEGQPVIQASLREPRRPDVRPWTPQPSGVSDYFDGGRTIDASVALQGARDIGNFRVSLGLRNAHGLTPNASARWLNAGLTGTARPTNRLMARGNLYLVGGRALDRPGTGFDEVNPASGFTRMGRQVDLGALRAHIRDSVEQINWIYTARNNPFFQSMENSNDDHRGHIIGGGELSYAFTEWLTGTLRGGTDNYHESRNIQISPGWKGGYPTPFGRGDFSGGGAQQQKNSSAERLANFSVAATRSSAFGTVLAGILGFEARGSSFQSTALVSDSTAGAQRLESSALDTGSTKATAAYFIGSMARADYFYVTGGARYENASRFYAADASTIYPSVSAGYDVARASDGLRNLGVGSALLRASWWRAGNEITPRALAQVFTRASPTFPQPEVPRSQVTGPERTAGTELAADLASTGRRLRVSLTGYNELSSEILVVSPGSSGPIAVAQRGEISNRGYELFLHAEPYRGSDVGWNVEATYARNRNRVESLGDGTSEVALGPSLWGATLSARVGEPLGSITGTRFLRDPNTQALVLKNGLPIPDASGVSVLGSWQPDWSTTVSTSLKYRGIELGLLLEIRNGGRIFSATNLWGSSAGTLSSTLVGRDTGLVVPGVDSATRTANTVNVSAEDYFHSLAAIQEPWVYDASFAKLRQARLSYQLPLRFLPGYREQNALVSIVGRNLITWAKAPNIDPETALSAGFFQGFEMGQLPTTRSLGVQLSVAP